MEVVVARTKHPQNTFRSQWLDHVQVPSILCNATALASKPPTFNRLHDEASPPVGEKIEWQRNLEDRGLADKRQPLAEGRSCAWARQRLATPGCEEAAHIVLLGVPRRGGHEDSPVLDTEGVRVQLSTCRQARDIVARQVAGILPRA